MCTLLLTAYSLRLYIILWEYTYGKCSILIVMILVIGINDGGRWKKSIKIIFVTNTIATSLSTRFQWYHGGHVHIPEYLQKNTDLHKLYHIKLYRVHLHTSVLNISKQNKKQLFWIVCVLFIISTYIFVNNGMTLYCLSFDYSLLLSPSFFFSNFLFFLLCKFNLRHIFYFIFICFPYIRQSFYKDIFFIK
jgi:hypothetical protein